MSRDLVPIRRHLDWSGAGFLNDQVKHGVCHSVMPGYTERESRAAILISKTDLAQDRSIQTTFSKWIVLADLWGKPSERPRRIGRTMEEQMDEMDEMDLAEKAMQHERDRIAGVTMVNKHRVSRPVSPFECNMVHLSLAELHY